MAKQGKVLKYDLSLPPAQFENYMDNTFPNRNNQGCEFTTFYGHIGDGNIHINVLFENHQKLREKKQEIEKALYRNLMDLKGSISAEHGIGQFKKEKLAY